MAALALARVGVPTVVLERAPKIRAIGAGLTLQVNAMRMLGAIGLAQQVMDAGEVMRGGRIETHEGVVLSSLGLEHAQDRHGFPSVAIHRGVLAELLAEELSRVGRIRCGAEVVGVASEADAVHVQLSDGSSIVGRALVGADGIRSAVREAVFGSATVRYAGYTCWRGIASLPRPLGPGTSVERWGPGRRFGIVPIDVQRTYWFATQNAPAGGRDGAEPRVEVLERFAGFAPPVRALIEATPSSGILRNDIEDLLPLSTWTRGRVTLLGDAAHAMTPNMGQGACQAIEDAVVLADSLARSPSIEEAFTQYERRRWPRAVRFVERSWQIGRTAQWESGIARSIRDTLTRWAPSSLLERSLDRDWHVEVPVFEAVDVSRWRSAEA